MNISVLQWYLWESFGMGSTFSWSLWPFHRTWLRSILLNYEDFWHCDMIELRVICRPMEEQRERYGPSLYRLTTFAVAIRVFLELWWSAFDSEDLWVLTSFRALPLVNGTLVNGITSYQVHDWKQLHVRVVFHSGNSLFRSINLEYNSGRCVKYNEVADISKYRTLWISTSWK
jgi:hypothetical protein